VQNFGQGRYPLPEIWRKNGVCYIEQCTLQRLLALSWALGEWPVSHYGCPAGSCW